MAEKFSNNPRTVLSGSIDSSTTSVVVVDASKFPSTGNFRILVDTEIMKVTSVSTNTFTVTRGAESTTPTSHVDASTVIGIFPTKDSLKEFRADNTTFDTVANRPSAGTAGRLYLPTDGNGPFAYDDGSNWKSIFEYVNTYTTPIPGNFSTLPGSTGGETFGLNGDTLVYFTLASNGSSGRIKSAPSEPWTLTVQMNVQFYPSQTTTDAHGSGILIRQSSISTSSTGTIAFGFWIDNLNGAFIGAERFRGDNLAWNNVALFTQAMTVWIERPMWFQIFQPASGNRTFSISCDGFNFITLFSQDRANVITPDQVGFFTRGTSNNARNMYMFIRSYKET